MELRQKELLLLIKTKTKTSLKRIKKKKNKNCVSIDKKNFFTTYFLEAVGGGEEGGEDHSLLIKVVWSHPFPIIDVDVRVS